MAPDISKKKKKKRKFVFPSAIEYTCNLYGTYTLKFIRYMTISKIQIDFEKGGYASVLAGVPDRSKN